LVGLILAMPITVSLKVVFQTIPELNGWAELMSVDWRSPPLAVTESTVAERPLASPALIHPGSISAVTMTSQDLDEGAGASAKRSVTSVS
jgi:hypothetical protein